ncbi:sorting nexin-8-like [Dendronephthya gigantea]|uniref:sorting nexin-8-like n=1 Tax=Dendronephthya gigantea TaxID=151771 RepID=UPI00106D62FF|nr:sorting nexin-8-like [Dendronephthya gigantea]
MCFSSVSNSTLHNPDTGCKMSMTYGTIPAFYREVYQTLCTEGSSKIDKDVLQKILLKAGLPIATVATIYESADPNHEGSVGRDGLYKALALTALVQQGKPPNEKLLEGYIGMELPRPEIGDITNLKETTIQVQKKKNPSVLGLKYDQLIAMDTISVDLVPEKKGILLKHNEYRVNSQKYKTTVNRRYRDFEALFDLLLSRYPYRMVPKLPPKKIGATKEFIESRRRSLKRFLNIVARHPVLNEDKMVVWFLTTKGSDIGVKLKDQFKQIPDEFMINPTASKSKDLVSKDTQIHFSQAREQIFKVHDSCFYLKEIMDRQGTRTLNYATDMLDIAKQLNNLSTDKTPVSSWASGTNTNWTNLKQGFKGLSVHFEKASEAAAKQYLLDEESSAEHLAYFLDVTSAYKDLCKRLESGVLKDHQHALQKMQQIKKRQIHAQARGQEHSAIDELESRIVQQENEISNMETRNSFSLHCAQLETQLVHANFNILHVALKSLVASQVAEHEGTE